jgi:SNF2 family DNA or RNA helicase
MQPPVGSGFVTPLRHYQKQSLAFMVDAEWTANRGEWLCDDVGMGKTAVVLALVVTNPAVANMLTKKQQFKAMMDKIDSNEKRRDLIRQAYDGKNEENENEFEDEKEKMDESNDVRDLVAAYEKFESKREVLYQDMQKQLAEVGRDQLIKLKTTIVFTHCH